MVRLIFMAELFNSMSGSSVITRVGRKGVVVIPKKLRDAVGLEEGSYVIMEIRGGGILLKPFTVKRVKLGGRVSEIVAEYKRGELELEG